MMKPGKTEQGAQESTGGWKSQSPILKVLLAVSLVCVVLGVWRCSMELVPSEGPRTVRVERATVSASDSLLAVPADSVAALVTRQFVRGLRRVHEAEVTTEAGGAAWAVVRLHVGASLDGHLELTGTAASTVSGRRLSAVQVSDTPDRLREMAFTAASDMSSDLMAAGGILAEER